MPRYPLDEVKAAIRDGRYWITRQAVLGAAGLGFDEDDIKGCVLGLHEGDLFKTMPARKRPGLSQDVHRCGFGGLPTHVKLQVDHGGWAVVISFKRDENA